jgi:hypothetical protein
VSKQHIIFMTEEEVKALANLARVAIKMGGEIPYIQELQKSGGEVALEKLKEKIKEINNDPNRK